MKKTRVALLPLIVSAAAPGPLLVRFLAITSSLLKVIVLGLGSAKVIVSPAAASASAWRREPGACRCGDTGHRQRGGMGDAHTTRWGEKLGDRQGQPTEKSPQTGTLKKLWLFIMHLRLLLCR